jgi:hypothetical protein
LFAVVGEASLAGWWCAGDEPKDNRREGEAEAEGLNSTKCGGASMSVVAATVSNGEAEAQSEKWTDEREEDENGSERIDEKPECAHRASRGSMLLANANYTAILYGGADKCQQPFAA